MNKHALCSLVFLLLIAMQTKGQQVLKGKLFDAATRETLIGATVLVKGTQNGSTSLPDGSFELKHEGELPLTLLVSYMGFESREVLVTDRQPLQIFLHPAVATFSEITVTSRRRKEIAQEVPIPITVLGSPQIENSVSFNVNRVKELVPSVQLYSSNPRNTTLNIRGLGSTFGLTNDGLDQGVGFYVDGVYYARPAASCIDFIDVEQIEVLRGPQGTLFGKNTTAGAFNVSTRKPSFSTSAVFELSYGNYGFVQAKGAISGGLIKEKLAARLSFTGTQREGLVYNVRTDQQVNSLNNLGVRGQLLFAASKNLELILSADHTRQRPDGYAQVFAGVAPTKRKAYRQFENIIKDLDYELPSRHPFDRTIDHDTPWRSDQDLGGVSLNAEYKMAKGSVTSTTAWRYWNWNPSNDRDFTGLQGLALSQAPSRHDQWSQEMRYAAEFSSRLSGVFGVFVFTQSLRPDSAHVEEAGKDQWRFSQNSESPLWQTPGLLDGFGIRSYPELRTTSAAVFGQLDWKFSDKISVMPGIRLNYDKKKVDFRRETYGGLQTSDSQLLALQAAVYTNQSFKADIDDTNVSGQVSLAYKFNSRVRSFFTYALGYKPVGLNLGGLPSLEGKPMVELASIKPERVHHLEAGMKSEPLDQLLLNITVYHTEISNYQTLVQSADLSVNRGYLANAEKVRVQGAEIDAGFRFRKALSFNGSLSYTEGEYVSFTNAPPPLEETGGATYKDISGGRLPGLSRWAAAFGLETGCRGKLIGKEGDFFLAMDLYYRSSFSSNPSPSAYLVVEGYSLLNGRVGFRAIESLSVFLWCRNILDKEYFEQLLPGAGNAGHYAGVLGDQRTLGITLRSNIN
ncbi:MAG: TonB-dependent receptor [Bacteroidia bacterium]|nr:TonB-dependent receptor [Bacteroidia bacterium]